MRHLQRHGLVAYARVLLLVTLVILSGLPSRAQDPRPKLITGDDRAEMVLIPAGEFWRGSSWEQVLATCEERGVQEEKCRRSLGDEVPRHRVYLDAFYLDKYEVTYAQYRQFMTATGRAAPAFWSNSQLNDPRQPVVGVTWQDAEGYCQWAGKRLPTEAEWEKAARGPEGRRYPWGEQWEAGRANAESKLGRPAPVGSSPGGVSPYGVYDLAGNVWEWVADWYEETYYQRALRRNPPGPSTGEKKVLRGGSWSLGPVALRTAYRGSSTPDSRSSGIGFRCAKGVP